MKFLSFLLRGYKPLSYGGIEELTIENFDQINVLTGENGKGKSSVLRELTPYPASRSDYHKNGYKRIEISHNGHHFILISDFSNNPPHSFLMDGTEKNVSGTGEVQSDLVEQHFEGYSRLIEKLVSGSCKFSMMSRNERKEIFMATYPSNLEFILKKYKTLSSMIRSGNSQINLLKERELKLKESFISDDILKYHQDNCALMNEALVAIDKDCYALEMAIKPFVESKEYNEDTPWTIDEIVDSIKSVYKEFTKLVDSGYSPSNVTELQWLSANMESQISNLDEQILYMTNNGQKWLQELEKYKEALSSDNNELLHQYKLDAEVQMDIIKKYPVRDDLAVMDIDSINWWIEHENWMDVLQPIVSNGGLWTIDKYQSAVNEINNLEYQIGEATRTSDRLIASRDALKKRLDKYEINNYPTDCSRVCKLRDSVKSIVDGLKAEYDTVCADLEKTANTLNACIVRKNSVSEAVSLRTASVEILRQFDMYFSNYSWKDFVLNHKSLIDSINSDLTGLVNRMHILINYSRGQEEARKALDKLRVVQARIDMIENEHLPSKQKMKEIVNMLESQLGSIEKEISDKREEKRKFVVRYGFVKTHSDLVEQLDTLYSNFTKLYVKTFLTSVVDFVRNEIRNMQIKKMHISEKLREFETVVKEQEGLRLRLNDEVLPTMSKIKKDIFKWEFIEEELSPVSGLPKRIMTKYINSIFQRANKFIAHVWNYEMELVYLKEEDDCDYTFPVLINNDGTVKDISICSKGQKEIIDLALILSICTYRGYSIKFPLKLDEMSSGLSPDHNSKLFGFLGELFSRDEILQAFIVSHDPIVNNGFDQAGYIALSDNASELCRVISKIK